MAQFDVCENLAGNTDKYPYVVILQSDLIELQGHDIVAPLSLSSRYHKALLAYPQVTVGGENWLAIIPQLSGMPHAVIGEKVASMQEQRTDFITAIDRLFTGF